MHYVDLVEASIYSLMNVPSDDELSDHDRVAQILATLSDYAEGFDPDLAQKLARFMAKSAE